MDKVNADIGNLFKRLDSIVDGFFRLLPNIGIAVVVLLLFWTAAWIVRRVIRRISTRKQRANLGQVLGSLAFWSIQFLGVLIAITIVAPSVKPDDLLAGLGIGSVAIGFAFKDILQNMLAGILILLRQPFEIGDQIVSGGHEGTVEKIETRATFLKTYDGQRVVIPNTEIYTDKVVVRTAFDHRRSEYDVGIGCNDDWAEAKTLMIDAARSVEGVLADPPPEAIPVAIGDFSNIIRLRWWTKSDRGDVINLFGDVVERVYRTLDENGIDMPYPTQVSLFHDQTEEVDGDRKKQREGWPAPKDGEAPKPARVVSALHGGGGNRAEEDRHDGDGKPSGS